MNHLPGGTILSTLTKRNDNRFLYRDKVSPNSMFLVNEDCFMTCEIVTKGRSNVLCFVISVVIDSCPLNNGNLYMLTYGIRLDTY